MSSPLTGLSVPQNTGTAQSTKSTFFQSLTGMATATGHFSLQDVYSALTKQGQHEQYTERLRAITAALETLQQAPDLTPGNISNLAKAARKTALQLFEQVGAGEPGDHIAETLTALTDKAERLQRLANTLKDAPENYNGQRLAGFLKERKKEVKQELSSVVFAAHIPAGHTAARANVEAHTGLIVFDIDHIGAAAVPPFIRDLAAAPYVALAFRSPSGDGVKFVVKVEGATVENHGFIWHEVASSPPIAAALARHGATLDPSGKDVNRHCYLPFEPGTYYNADAAPFRVDPSRLESWKVEQGARERKRRVKALFGPKNERETVEAICDHLEKTGQSITASYENWIKVGFTLIHSLPEDEAREFFHRLSCLDHSYDLDKCDRKFEQLQSRPPSEPVTLGTLVFLAVELAGFEPPKKAKGVTAFDPAPAIEFVTIQGEGNRVSDYAERIISLLGQHGKIIIKAPTGSGKTYAHLKKQIGEKIGIAHALYNMTKQRVIFAAPLKLITGQTRAFGVPVIDGNASEAELLEAKSAPVVVVTYASLKAVSTSPENEILIIDEVDQLIRADHMKKDLQTVWEHAKVAPYVIGLSATPPRWFERHGFTYVRLPIAAQQRRKIIPLVYEGELLPHIIETAKRHDLTKGALIIRLNDKTKGEALALALKDALAIPEGKHAAVIHAGTRGQDRDYLHQNEKLSEDIAVCICTSVNDTGVNINSRVCGLIIADDQYRSTPEERAQFIGRPRLSNDLPVHILTRKKRFAEEPVFDCDHAAELYTELIENAKNIAACYNAAQRLEAVRYDEISSRYVSPFTWFNDESGQHETDNLAIMLAVEKRIQGSRNLPGELVALQLLSEALTVEAVEYIGKADESEVTAIYEAHKAAKSAAGVEIATALCKDPETVKNAIYHSTTDEGIRKSIWSLNPSLTAQPGPAALELMKDKAESLALTDHKETTIFLALEKNGFTTNEAVGIAGGISADYLEKQTEAIQGQISRLESAKEKTGQRIEAGEKRAETQRMKATTARTEAKAREYEKAAATSETMNRRRTAKLKEIIATLESLQAEAERLQTYAAAGAVCFSESFARDQLDAWEINKLIKLSSKAETRKRMAADQLDTADKAKAFRREIMRRKDRSIKPGQLQQFARQIYGDHIPGTFGRDLLKSLFEYSTESAGRATVYRVKAALSCDIFCHKWDIDFDSYIAKNQIVTYKKQNRKAGIIINNTRQGILNFNQIKP